MVGNRPWWEYLHHCNRWILQIRAWFLFPKENSFPYAALTVSPFFSTPAHRRLIPFLRWQVKWFGTDGVGGVRLGIPDPIFCPSLCLPPGALHTLIARISSHPASPLASVALLSPFFYILTQLPQEKSLLPLFIPPVSHTTYEKPSGFLMSQSW